MARILTRALINAIGTFVYVVLIVSFIFSLQIFAQKEDIIVIPMAMLMLFVCSAAITGFLVFGKPAMLYLDGQKKEAILLLVYTLTILFLITLVLFILLIIYYGLFI